MKVKDIMSESVIRISPEESVAVAARTLTHYNIGALPVCSTDGRICGVVTDRDIVTRCIASEKAPEKTSVREIMTGRLIVGTPDMEVAAAAELMGREQIRRLPVASAGKLCGMVSLGDISEQREEWRKTAETLANISNSVSKK